MEDWIVSGRLIDAIFVLIAIEAAILVVLRRPRLAPVDVVFLLLPGAFLFLALRVALTTGEWRFIALALTGALISHLADVARRLKR